MSDIEFIPEDDEPRPALLGDGDMFICDPIGLAKQCGAVAFRVEGRELYALKTTGQWVNIQTLPGKPKSALSAVT